MKFILPLVLFGYLFSSCGNPLYVSNAVNMPLLRQKGDFNINWGRRFVSPSNLDFQSSIAPLDNFVLALNGMAMRGELDPPSDREFKNRFIEAGAGVFQAFSDGTDEKPYRVELIGGYGLGKSSNIYEKELVSDGQYLRKFLQPGIGLRMDYFDFGVGVRISEINFSHYARYSQGIITEQGAYNFTTIEPVMTMAVGFRRFKLAGQLGTISSSGGEIDFENALDDELFKVKVYAAFNITNYRKPKPIPPAPELIELDTIQLEVQPINIQVYHPKCWACFRHKGSAKDDFIDLRYNGVEIKSNIKLTKSFSCFQLAVLSEQDNWLEMNRSNGKKPKEPMEILVKDGKVERRFFLNITAGQSEVIRLKI